MSELADFVGSLEPGRRGEILGAAAEVFAERGYESGSMRDIAARVGVSEPSLRTVAPACSWLRMVGMTARADWRGP